jgi:hypothetical protein
MSSRSIRLHRGSLPEGQPTLIFRPGTPFLDSFTVVLLKVLLECQGLGRIVGVGGLLVLSPALITPAETDVWRAWIPAKTARECRPFPVFHGECLCQTEQAFGQTREGFSIFAPEVSCRGAAGAAQQRRSFPGSSLIGTGIPQNSPTKSYDKMLRQRHFREDEEAQVADSKWLPPRDSNPDMLIQSQMSGACLCRELGLSGTIAQAL